MKLIFIVLGIVFLQTVLAYSAYKDTFDNRVDSDEKILPSSGLKYEIPKNFRLRTPGNFQVPVYQNSASSKRYMKYLEEQKKIDDDNLFFKQIENQEPCLLGLARDRHGNCKEVW